MRHGTTSALTVLVAAGALAMPLGPLAGLRSTPNSPSAGAPGAGAPTAPALARTPTRATENGACGPEPRDAAGWSQLFDHLDGDWAGGDGTSSTRLPDGRILWVFGDTVTGEASADGRRTGSVALLHNSVLITSGTCVTSLTSGVAPLPTGDGTWLWPTHAVVTRVGDSGSGSTVTVFAQRIARTGAGAFDFRRVATSVVSLDVSWGGGATVTGVRDVADASVLWGAAVVVQGSTAWIYGTRDAGPGTFGRELLLARAPTASADDRGLWHYRTHDGWSRDPAHAVVVRRAQDGVSTVLSGARLDARVVLVTKPQEFLDDRVVALSAARPWGPWTQRTLLLAPSTADEPRYSPALVVGTEARHAVVVVNRTSTSLETLLTDSTSARPTFYDVDLAD